MEALWKTSIGEHHLSSLVLLLVPTTSPSIYKDWGLQTNEGLDVHVALKQLQVATQAKSQLKWDLLCKQYELDAKEDKLIATHNREISKIWAKAEKEIDKMTLQFQEEAVK